MAFAVTKLTPVARITTNTSVFDPWTIGTVLLIWICVGANASVMLVASAS
jgi:hypothetical protein